MSTASDFEIKERVRLATDIVDVIGRELELRPQGRNLVARCPFHNDKRPSMTVNPERQTWKCWVCDIGGDVFSYVMQREGIDFPTALRSLAEAAGIELPQFQRGPKTQPGQPDDRATLIAALELIANAYFEQLTSGRSDDAKIARDYLRSRGIDDANRERFRIGFAPDSWDFANNLLQKSGYSAAVARATGLVVARPNSADSGANGGYDRFRGRLMFPIRNVSGQTISLGGRIIPQIAQRFAEAKGDSSAAGAKYINGPETLLFRKSNELYGLDLARDSIRKSGQVLVMEGYTDVIAGWVAGVQNVVAVLGTALTESHVRILKRYAPRVVLVLDGDEAGRRRADEVLSLFVKADVDMRVLTLPDGADPADFLNAHSAENLSELVTAAPDAMQHKLNRLTDGVDIARDTHRVTTAIETMLGILSQVPAGDDRGQIKVEQLLQRMSDVFSMNVDRLRQRLESIRQTSRSREEKKPVAKRPGAPALPASDPFDEAAAMDELAYYGLDSGASSSYQKFNKPAPLFGIDRQLIETLLESPEMAAMAVESIDPQWLHSPTAQMLLSAYQDLDLAGRDLTANALLTMLENDFLKSEVSSLLEKIDMRSVQYPDRVWETPQTRYTAILTRYREREFELEKNRQIERLKTTLMPEEEELALLQELFAAERIRQTPR